MSTIKKQRTIPKPKPQRKPWEDEEDEFRWRIVSLESDNDGLGRENRDLRQLVVQLSLGKLAAEWELRNPEPEPSR